jgi:hypothetical protein
VLLTHLEAHPRAHHFVRDNQGRFERYWGRNHPAVLVSSSTPGRLGTDEVMLLTDALLATERSPRNTALAAAVLAVEGDLRSAWDRSDQGARNHGLSVVAQAGASFEQCLESYQQASQTDMAPIRRSALFGMALTASLVGREQVVDLAVTRLLEEEPQAVRDCFRQSCESLAPRIGLIQASRAIERFFTSLGSDRANELSLTMKPLESA